MIKIDIPNNNLSERKYIIDILFTEFLGLAYVIKFGSENYEIILPNNKQFIIQDTFFNKFPNDLEYLKLDNIPTYFDDLDIFAQCFFMLTRWEEYVNKIRDEHGRFPARESLAYKQGFLDRPVVNEAVEKLKTQLLELDNSLKFKKREYQLILTHDVDHLYFWKNSRQLIRIVLGDILKRRDLSLAFSRIKEYFLVKTKKIKDPFDTFDWLMEISESIGAKSKFYFMSGGVTEYDNNYKIDEPKAVELIKKIKERGHIIGIHPSYNAYNDAKQFKKEKYLLEKLTGQKIIEGREHFLRFEVPATWQIWEDNSMETDSTCGYADKEGFRCGTGDEFSVFNILTRKKLKLKERPLIVMDGSFTTYQADMNSIEIEQRIKSLIKSVQEYQGRLVFLWHNSSFYGQNQKIYQKMYKRILEL